MEGWNVSGVADSAVFLICLHHFSKLDATACFYYYGADHTVIVGILYGLFFI